MKKIMIIIISIFGCIGAYAQLPDGKFEIPHSHSLDADNNDITKDFPWREISITSMNMNFGFGNWASIMFYYKGGFGQASYMTDYNYSGNLNIDGELFYKYTQKNMFMGESYIIVNRNATKALVQESMGGKTHVFLK